MMLLYLVCGFLLDFLDFVLDGVCCMWDLDINQVPSSGIESWANGSIEEEDDKGGPPRKKLRLTKEQSCLLEESFRENQTSTPVGTFSFHWIRAEVKTTPS
ncbi:hypothetical protein AAC387_Pa02g1629 [Persea americana]